MAARLPAGAQIVATDLNQPMLDYAKARHSGADRERIEWKQADAQALPFREQSFDVVACQFGVMFFPDKVQGYKEARRVLKPGGQFIFTVLDKISENDFAETVTQALASVFPHDPSPVSRPHPARLSRRKPDSQRPESRRICQRDSRCCVSHQQGCIRFRSGNRV